MKWKIAYSNGAIKDLKKLDGSQKKLVLKAIDKVSNNPLSQLEGWYGKPLSNKNSLDLSGYYKIKLKKSGLRIVYKLMKINKEMYIIIIGARSDNEVYELAYKRIKKETVQL